MEEAPVDSSPRPTAIKYLTVGPDYLSGKPKPGLTVPPFYKVCCGVLFERVRFLKFVASASPSLDGRVFTVTQGMAPGRVV